MRWEANAHTFIRNLPQCSDILDTFNWFVVQKKRTLQSRFLKDKYFMLYVITDTLPHLCITIAKYYKSLQKMEKIIFWTPFWLSLEIKY